MKLHAIRFQVNIALLRILIANPDFCMGRNFEGPMLNLSRLAESVDYVLMRYFRLD